MSKLDERALEAAARAWDREDAAQMGEPAAELRREAVRLLEKFADPDGHSDGLDEDTAVAFWPATAGDIRDVRVFLSRLSRKDTDNG